MIFTIIFVIEMLFKLITDGVVFHRLAYFRNSWNILDSVIVTISVVSLVLSMTTEGAGSQVKALKALRALRVLRPLRVVKRHPQLKTTVLCIISSIPAMMTVGVVLLLYMFVMAMFCVQFFKGQFFRCYDQQNVIYYGSTPYPTGNLYTASVPLSGPTSIPTIIECASKTGGLGVWQDSNFTFNNVFMAILCLFEMSTTEGWLHVMAGFVDAPALDAGKGLTPLPNQSPYFAFFCFIHIMIGSFVLLNLLVGTIITNYITIKNREDGVTSVMTDEQIEWAETRKLIMDLKPRKRRNAPDSPVRLYFFNIANSNWFDFFITLCILANFVCMLTKQHDDGCEVVANMVWINFAFSMVFNLEAIIKLIGLGPRWYFQDDWNKADLAIVFLSLGTNIVDFATNQHICTGNLDDTANSVPGLSVLRAFRLARVFRLIRRAKSLRSMIRTLFTSIPALFNIMSLICLFLLIFAVLGTTLFWNVNPEQDLFGGVDDAGNYALIDNAVFLLFRQTTGETWNSIMYYCSQFDIHLACDLNLEDYENVIGCGDQTVGPIYHMVWQFVGNYLMMQLITAVILENFTDIVKDDESVISTEALNLFVDKWNLFDPDAEGVISTLDLPKLLCELKPPLGVKSDHFSSIKLLAVIKDLAIPVRGGDSVRYKDTFLALVRRAQAQFPEEDEDIFESSSSESEVSDNDNDDPYAMDGEAQRSARHRNDSPPPSGRSRHGGEHVGDDETQEEEDQKIFRGRRATIAEDYAARLLQGAYKEWRENRIQVQKGRITTLIPLADQLDPERLVASDKNKSPRQ